MNPCVYKKFFLDNKNYSITTDGTVIRIRFKNDLVYNSLVKNKFIELDSFHILPDFLENLYDQNLKEFAES